MAASTKKNVLFNNSSGRDDRSNADKTPIRNFAVYHGDVVSDCRFTSYDYGSIDTSYGRVILDIRILSDANTVYSCV